jgi:tetratricopeptide (TPR) repeat protein
MGKRYVSYAYPVAAFFVMSLFVAFYFQMTTGISRTGEMLIYLGGIGLGLVAGALIDLTSGRAAKGIVRVMTGSGNITPAPSFSYQESLVATGKYAEAAEAYLQHLNSHPDDHHARIALADLCASHLGDFAAAERHYLEVRAADSSPRLRRLAGESLIDLYRKTGRRGQLMAELARTAAQYPGTAEADAAKRALMELKREGDLGS